MNIGFSGALCAGVASCWGSVHEYRCLWRPEEDVQVLGDRVKS